MRRHALSLLLCAALSAQTRETARHLIRDDAPLTAASARLARDIARDFLASTAADVGLETPDLDGIYLRREYVSPVNGVTHFAYKQRFLGIDVFGADWVVNVDRDGRVLNAGGSLYRRPGLGVQPPGAASVFRAARTAVSVFSPSRADAFQPLEVNGPGNGTFRLRGSSLPEDVEGTPVWFPVNGTLQPAWAFVAVAEDNVTASLTVISAEGDAVLHQRPMTFFYQAPGPRGLVFERGSPQPNPAPGVPLVAPPPYVQRTAQSFSGDPTASPRGWVQGNQTSGNNTTVGLNPLGTLFLATPRLTQAQVDGTFTYPLELGPDSANPTLFPDAANVNLFYWINRTHDLFHAVGFDEAAGAYQNDNFGRGGVGNDAIKVYAQYGSAAQGAAARNNAFYTTRRVEDGDEAMIAMYLGTAPGVFADGAYDAGVIVHEYAHGVSLRLVRNLSGHQGGAMGEAWSDFFSREFTIPEGSPVDGSYVEGEYLFQAFGPGIRTYPYSTDLTVNPITFADLGRVSSFPAIHQDGGIWVQALWEVRANLIRQFGEREGRRRMRILVIEGMKLTPPAPTMVDARDGVLLADRVTFDGASQSQIWQGFAKRGLGVLAQSSLGPDSLRIVPSFERPSGTAQMRFSESAYVLGDLVQLTLHDANETRPTLSVLVTGGSGDREPVLLTRRGSTYSGAVFTTQGAGVTRGDGFLSLMTADSITAYYVDPRGESGTAQPMDASVETRGPYFFSTLAPSFPLPANEIRLNFRAPFGAYTRVTLPFDFPFFGQRQRSVFVHASPLLTFDFLSPSLCANAASLTQVNGIAPLWIEARTSGTAQPNEDVYLSQTEDSVTFRWVAETDTVAGLSPSEPVNVAATLFRDGRIEFLYGSGNRNLSVIPPFSGCAVSSPVVGLSNGSGAFAQSAVAYTGRVALENAAAVAFEPARGFSSIPAGTLESPAAGESVRDLLTLRGFVLDGAHPVIQLHVLIDGVLRGRTSVGQLRPDVCSGRTDRSCPAPGFALTLNTAALGLAPGDHRVQIRATNSRGAFSDFPEQPRSFRVEAGQSRAVSAVIELPASDATLENVATVRGYAAVDGLRVTGVDVLIDGVTYGRALYGEPRAEVCSGLPFRSPNCPGIGWTFALNTTSTTLPLANGRHTLQVRVVDEAGRLTLAPEVPISFTVANAAANQLPIGLLTSHASGDRVSGTIRLAGHAYDPDGTIRLVTLLVDGVPVTTARYGEPRPEACASLPDVAACPNIGVAIDFDTRLLANGPHSFAFQAVDSRGGSTLFPRVARNGVPLVVANGGAQ